MLVITKDDMPRLERMFQVFDTVAKNPALSNCLVGKYIYDSPAVGPVEVSYIMGEDHLRVSFPHDGGKVFYSDSLAKCLWDGEGELEPTPLPVTRVGMNLVVDQLLPS